MRGLLTPKEARMPIWIFLFHCALANSCRFYAILLPLVCAVYKCCPLLVTLPSCLAATLPVCLYTMSHVESSRRFCAPVGLPHGRGFEAHGAR